MRISGRQYLPQQGRSLIQGFLQRDGVVLLLDAEGAVIAAVPQGLQEAAPPGGVVAPAGVTKFQDREANSSTPLVSSRVFCPAAFSSRTSLMWTW